MANFYRDLIKILTEQGCGFVRTGKGSHEIGFSPANGKHITIPRTTKSRHMANEILKQAGLEKEF